MKAILRLRQIIVILLLITGLITVISGIALFLAPSGPGSNERIILGLRKYKWTNLHTYISFVTTGLAIMHISINWRALKYYLTHITKE